MGFKNEKFSGFGKALKKKAAKKSLSKDPKPETPEEDKKMDDEESIISKIWNYNKNRKKARKYSGTTSTTSMYKK